MVSAAPDPPVRITSLAEVEDFDLGGLRISPARREVRFGEERRELEPQVIKVLVALASARPQVLSRDRLIEQCWDGRIVGDDTLNRCIVALRHLAKSFSPPPFEIDTVRGVGYALVAAPSAESRKVKFPASKAARIVLAGLVGAALVLAGTLAWLRATPSSAEPASIAVLPFRSLSGDDAYFAEGIGEEIQGRLGRDQEFRVAGRSSSNLFGPDPDIQEVARRLDVDYVLQGTVRRQVDRVRVNAALIRVSDRTQLWADSYDGTIDDVFEIQQRIGGAIAASLERKLSRTSAPASAPTDPKAYDLYLAGRALLRTRNRQVGPTATGVLRDAIDIDPNYAPAWASLATAAGLEGGRSGYDALIASRPLTRQYAQRALQLDPELGQAHRALGEVSGFGSPAFRSHLRTAAQLDPGDAENLIWLGVVQGAEGSFDQELATYRRAFALDPLWFRTTGQLAIALAELGKRREAEAVVRDGMASDAVNRNLLLGRIAWIVGDASEAARQWSGVAKANSARWSDTAQRNLDDVLFSLGLRDRPGEMVPRAPDMRNRGLVWKDAPPDSATWLARNRNEDTVDVYRAENCVAAKLMLRAGRARELVATYDRPLGLVTVRAGQPVRADQLREVPVVAIALKQVGRVSEASRLLAEAENLATSIASKNVVPFWFDSDAAAIYSLRGNTDIALSKLETARRRGWTHSNPADLNDLADEPALAALRGNPRFKRLRVDLKAHKDRERAETLRLQLLK